MKKTTRTTDITAAIRFIFRAVIDERCGGSESELARRLGLAQRSINDKIRAGATRKITASDMQRLCDYLGESLPQLLLRYPEYRALEDARTGAHWRLVRAMEEKDALEIADALEEAHRISPDVLRVMVKLMRILIDLATRAARAPGSSPYEGLPPDL